VAAFAVACDVYQPPDQLGDGHGHGDEGAPIELSDTCTSEDIPVVQSDEAHHPTGTTDLDDNFSGFPGCGGTSQLPGPDGFVRVIASAGDRWHIEAEPEDDDLDVAIYMMPTCDALACQLLVDRCGAGWAEDFTFVAETAGEYLIGIDGSDPAGGELDLLVLRTQCGDGVVDHGESCDDGNLAAGDGCGPECRLEMAPTDDEVEPNNWHTSANVIRFGGDGTGTSKIGGRLGGPCDTDHYAVQVPPGAHLYAAMLSGAELACADDHAEVDMMLMERTSGRVRGRGAPAGRGGGCPSIEPGDEWNENLAGGEYHLTITAVGEPDQFDYVLEIEIVRGPE
jgi:cysteine-rich repeat protein